MKSIFIVSFIALSVNGASQTTGQVYMTATGGVTIPNGAVTSSMLSNGSIDLTSKVTGMLPVANGGTGASTASVARDNLGLTIGVNVLSPTGDGSGLTGLTKSQVGLGSVENTALSTWGGSGNITTIGTLSSGTVPVARVSGLAAVATSGSATDLSAGSVPAARFGNTTIPVSAINATGTPGSGNYLRGDGTWGVPVANAATFVNLANNFSSSSTTPAAVTGWTFSVTSGVTYRIQVIAAYQTAATTTGGILGISLTGATGSVRGWAKGTIVSTAAASELTVPIVATSGTGSTLTTTGVTAINSPHYIGMDITFTCTGSGTFNIVWGTEVNASAAQLNQNSTLLYQALN